MNLCFGMISSLGCCQYCFCSLVRWDLLIAGGVKKKLKSQILISRLPMPFCLIYSFLLSQHGCKKCGHIFCSGCTSNLLVLPEHGSKKVKVCDQCYRNATRWLEFVCGKHILCNFVNYHKIVVLNDIITLSTWSISYLQYCNKLWQK